MDGGLFIACVLFVATMMVVNVWPNVMADRWPDDIPLQPLFAIIMVVLMFSRFTKKTYWGSSTYNALVYT